MVLVVVLVLDKILILEDEHENEDEKKQIWIALTPNRYKFDTYQKKMAVFI